jgi:hypothetical protein
MVKMAHQDVALAKAIRSVRVFTIIFKRYQKGTKNPKHGSDSVGFMRRRLDIHYCRSTISHPKNGQINIAVYHVPNLSIMKSVRGWRKGKACNPPQISKPYSRCTTRSGVPPEKWRQIINLVWRRFYMSGKQALHNQQRELSASF